MVMRKRDAWQCFTGAETVEVIIISTPIAMKMTFPPSCSQAPDLVSFMPSGGSVWQILHFAQLDDPKCESTSGG